MTAVEVTSARERAELAREQAEEAERVLGDTIRDAIVEGTRPLFDKYPFLGEIAWTQYTPYFNDGDPCVFRSDVEYPSVSSVVDVEEGTAGRYEDPGEDFGRRCERTTYGSYDPVAGRYSQEPNPDFEQEYADCRDEVVGFFRALGSSSAVKRALESVFGDHALVRVTRDGIVVDEYDHD